MSFAAPLVLIALALIPLAVLSYVRHQRTRTRAAAAFVTEPLRPSVLPRGPRWRRHAPMVAFVLALSVLIVAAARPQRSKAVPLQDGAVVLANDVSSSMASADVSPTRLAAAQHAAQRFVSALPSSIRVGLVEFNQRAVVLQSVTSDHSLVRQALSELRADGHTAIGDGIDAALGQLAKIPAVNGKRPPGAIVLLSDGFSTTGTDPLAAARRAAAQHVPIYTVELGTSHGTIAVKHGARTTTMPVPIAPQQLQQIAQIAGGRTFTVGDAGHLNAVYSRLSAQLGRKHIKSEITSEFAGAGLVLLLLGSGMSLLWFGRLI